MIKHIVIWRLAECAPDEKRSRLAELKRVLEGLNGKIPGLERLEVGINYNTGEFASDAILYSEFTDRASLDAYQVHPEHKAVVPYVLSISAERRVVDYEA